SSHSAASARPTRAPLGKRRQLRSAWWWNFGPSRPADREMDRRRASAAAARPAPDPAARALLASCYQAVGQRQACEEHAAAARIQAVHRGNQARSRSPQRAQLDAEVEDLDPFARDALRLLRSYPDLRAERAREAEEARHALLARAAKEAPAAAPAPPQRAPPEEPSAPRRAEVELATHRFTQALREQHEVWVSAREELVRSSLQMRHQEVDAARREFADPELGSWLRQHAEEHLSRLRRDGREGAPHEAASKDEGDASEICSKVLPHLRQEWRAGQRALLQQISKELRTEREAARKALEAQVLHAEKVAEASRECWAGELRVAAQELERLERCFQEGLEAACSAELRAVQKHTADQAAFFQRELREALQTLQEQQAGPASQLRRARLAMLKWRQDYIRDARSKARVAVQLRRAAAKAQDAAAELRARGASLQCAPGDHVAVLRDRSWRAGVVTEADEDGSLRVEWEEGTPRSAASSAAAASGPRASIVDPSEEVRVVIEDGAERVEFFNVFPGERAGKKVTIRVRSDTGPSGLPHPKSQEGLEVVVDDQGRPSLVEPLRHVGYDPATRDLTLTFLRRHGAVTARIPAGEDALVVPRVKWMASLVGVPVEGVAKGYPELHDDLQRVEFCRELLGEVWQRLPVAEERRAFLLRLARRVPCAGEVQRLNEEYLAEHGVLGALPARGGAPCGAA
ncbi:unnamed protein product, partial [Prorocentrum cordatum]